MNLDESYALCRQMNKRHGATYYWSTKLLPRAKQRHVHALYAFARYADDIVDEPPVASDLSGPQSSSRLDHVRSIHCLREHFFTDLDVGSSSDPILNAVIHTVREFDIDPEIFGRFLCSMEMDLTIASYETWDNLVEYMDGSAAAIGEMILPILEPTDYSAALPHARELGLAFQLTNFLRDIDEDLDRGRQYIPLGDSDRFEVDLRNREVTPQFVELMKFEIDRCRELYVSASLGIEFLPPRSARCVRAAHELYSNILDEIELLGYDVFSHRATVSSTKKATTVSRLLRP